MKIKPYVAALGLFCLSGCLEMKIDEGVAFAPPKRDFAGPAASPEALDQRWRAFVGPEKIASLGAVAITHGVWASGADRTAWTMFSAGADPQRPLIVHCAGNGGDRYNSAIPYARKALPFGDVLAFDYPGYGDSSGSPSGPAFETMLPKVLAAARASGRPIVFWGQSLGGFVCARMAALAPEARALILETSARNASQVAKAWTPWYASAVVRVSVAESLAGYDNADAGATFGGPVLVIGAGRDEVLPVRLARALADDLKQRGAAVRYVELANAGHMTAPDQPEFTPELQSFFTSLPKS